MKRQTYKFSEGKREAFLELLAKGNRRGAALEQIGLSWHVYSDWIEKHPEFRKDVEAAELEACDLVEDALWLKCVQDRHYGSIIFWLLNRSQGRWQDCRNLTVTHNELAPFSPTTQQAIMADLNKLKDVLPDTPTTGEVAQ